jgi:hypothetical protein
LGAVAAVGPPAAAGADPPELLDIHVGQLTGPVTLVSIGSAQLLTGGPVQITQPADPEPDQHPVHPRGADCDALGAQFGGDTGRAQLAFPAQPLDAALDVGRDLAGAVRGPAGAVDQRGLSLRAPTAVPLGQALA